MANTLFVMPTDKAGNEVILHERDSAHPGPDNEIFLRGYADHARREKEGAVEVGDTPAVRNKIHDGYLVETTKAGKEKASTS